MQFPYKALFGSFHWPSVFRTTLRTPGARSSYTLQHLFSLLSLSSSFAAWSGLLLPGDGGGGAGGPSLFSQAHSLLLFLFSAVWNPLPSAPGPARPDSAPAWPASSGRLSLPFSPDNQKVSSSNAAHFSLDVQTPSLPCSFNYVPSVFAVTPPREEPPPLTPSYPTFSFVYYLVSSRSFLSPPLPSPLVQCLLLLFVAASASVSAS